MPFSWPTEWLKDIIWRKKNKEINLPFLTFHFYNYLYKSCKLHHKCTDIYVPSLLCAEMVCAELVMCRVCYVPSWPGADSNFIGIEVTCRSKVAKIFLIGNPRWPPSWKSILNFFSWTERPVDSNLSGNQVSDTGPCWPSCFYRLILNTTADFFFFFFNDVFSIYLKHDLLWILARSHTWKEILMKESRF